MKATVNNKVNRTEKNLSFNASESLAKFLKMARMCKEKQEATPTYDMMKFNISQENYDKISAMLRLTGNGDISVSAYFEAVILDFLMTHGEDEIKQLMEEILKRRN